MIDHLIIVFAASIQAMLACSKRRACCLLRLKTARRNLPALHAPLPPKTRCRPAYIPSIRQNCALFIPNIIMDPVEARHCSEESSKSTLQIVGHHPEFAWHSGCAHTNPH